MDVPAQIDMVVELLKELGIEVRREHLSGECGGLCRMRGRQVLFVDEDADPASRLEHCLEALATLQGTDAIFLPPEIRERLDRLRSKDG